MEFIPYQWAVVLVGRWNKSILTPARVAQKIYELEENTGLEVKVPIDGISPYQIKHPTKNIKIITGGLRLQINLTQMCFSDLKDAMDAGIKTLEWLPETPVSAVGYNVNYIIKEPLPEIIEKFITHKIDARLGEFAIKKRTLGRTLEYLMGIINISFILKEDCDIDLLFNFHCDSNDFHILIEWLRNPTENIKAFLENVNDKMGIGITNFEEIINDGRSD